MKHILVMLVGLFTIFGGGKSEAATITIDVISATEIELTLSGTITGPETNGSNNGMLFISIPDAPTANYASISGDMSVGGNGITSSFVGYDNLPFSDALQLRSGLNGANGFSVGDILSGSGVITFSSAHNLTQSMFDGQGAAIYWLGNLDIVQGYAVSPSAVPLPATLPLLVGGIGLVAMMRRRRARP